MANTADNSPTLPDKFADLLLSVKLADNYINTNREEFEKGTRENAEHLSERIKEVENERNILRGILDGAVYRIARHEGVLEDEKNLEDVYSKALAEVQAGLLNHSQISTHVPSTSRLRREVELQLQKYPEAAGNIYFREAEKEFANVQLSNSLLAQSLDEINQNINQYAVHLEKVYSDVEKGEEIQDAHSTINDALKLIKRRAKEDLQLLTESVVKSDLLSQMTRSNRVRISLSEPGVDCDKDDHLLAVKNQAHEELYSRQLDLQQIVDELNTSRAQDKSELEENVDEQLNTAGLPIDERKILREQNRLLEKLYSCTEAEADSVIKCNDVLRAEKKALIEDIDELLAQNRAMKDELTDLTHANKTSRSSDSSSKSSHDRKIQENIIDDLIDRNEQLVNDLEELLEENKKLSATNDRLIKENESMKSMQGKVAAVYSENQELVEENGLLTEEIEDLQKRLQQQEDTAVVKSSEEADALQDELSEVKKQMGELKLKFIEIDDDRSYFKHQLQTLQAMRRPKVIHVRNEQWHVIATCSSTEDGQPDDPISELASALLTEKERREELMQEYSKQQEILSSIAALLNELGWSELNVGCRYNVLLNQAEHESDSDLVVSNELHDFLLGEQKLWKWKQYVNNSIDFRKEMQYEIDELNLVLKESYARCDKMAEEIKSLKANLKSTKDEFDDLKCYNAVLEDRVNNGSGNKVPLLDLNNTLETIPEEGKSEADSKCETDLSDDEECRNLRKKIHHLQADIQRLLDESNIFKKCLVELGIPKLQRGVKYRMHFQASREGDSPRRRISLAYSSMQGGDKLLEFDDVLDLLAVTEGRERNDSILSISFDVPTKDRSSPVKEILQKRDSKMSLVNSSQVSHNALESVLAVGPSLEMFGIPAIAEEKTGGKTGKLSQLNLRIKELETMLYISERSKEDLEGENRSLRKEMTHVKQSIHDLGGLEVIDEEANESDDEQQIEQRKSSGGQSANMIEKLYNLSQAKVEFLIDMNRKFEARINQIQLVMEQERCARMDLMEENDSLVQERLDVEEKCKKISKTAKEYARDNEYLERDIAYLRQKLKIESESGEVSVDADDDVGLNKLEWKQYQEITDLKADVENLRTEKKTALEECESLQAKVRFLTIEKEYSQAEVEELEEKIRQLEEQIKEPTRKESSDSIDPKRSSDEDLLDVSLCANRTTLRRKSGVMTELQKSTVSDEPTREAEILKTKVKNLERELQNVSIELESFRAANKEMRTRLCDAEDQVEQLQRSQASEHARRHSVQVKEFEDRVTAIERASEQLDNASDIQHDVQMIKEDVVLLAQENEEIRESNNALLRRNFALRKESLTSISAVKQLELLQSRIATLESENDVLKLELLKSSRGVYEQFEERPSVRDRVQIYQDENQDWGYLKLDQSTQTSTFKELIERRLESVKNQAEEEKSVLKAQIDEIKVAKDDLLRRNAVLKMKVYDQENIANAEKAERENISERYKFLLTENQSIKSELRFLKTFTSVSINASKTLENIKEGDAPATEQSHDANVVENVEHAHQKSTEKTDSMHKNDILRDYELVELQEERQTLMYENSLLKEEVRRKEQLFEASQRQVKLLNQSLIELDIDVTQLDADHVSLTSTPEPPSNKRKVSRKNTLTNANVDGDSKTSEKENNIQSLRTDLKNQHEKVQELTAQNAECKKVIDLLQQQLFLSTRPNSNSYETEKTHDTVDELRLVQDILQRQVSQSSSQEDNADDSLSLPSVHSDDLMSDFDFDDLFRKYSMSNMETTSSSQSIQASEDTDKTPTVSALSLGDIRFDDDARLDDTEDELDETCNAKPSVSRFVVDSKVVEARYDPVNVHDYDVKIIKLTNKLMEYERTNEEQLRTIELLAGKLDQDAVKQDDIDLERRKLSQELEKVRADFQVERYDFEEEIKRLNSMYEACRSEEVACTALSAEVDRLRESSGKMKERGKFSCSWEVGRFLCTISVIEDNDNVFNEIKIEVTDLDPSLEVDKQKKETCDAYLSTNNSLAIDSFSEGEESSVSEGDVTEEKVQSLKTKLRDARKKNREKERVIRNQNEDIDNFLSDIRKKDTQIVTLQQDLETITEKLDDVMRKLEDGKEASLTAGDKASESTDVLQYLMELAAQCYNKATEIRRSFDIQSDGRSENSILQPNGGITRSEIVQDLAFIEESLQSISQALTYLPDSKLRSDSIATTDSYAGSHGWPDTSSLLRRDRSFSMDSDIWFSNEKLKEELSVARKHIAKLEASLKEQANVIDSHSVDNTNHITVINALSDELDRQREEMLVQENNNKTIDEGDHVKDELTELREKMEQNVEELGRQRKLVEKLYDELSSKDELLAKLYRELSNKDDLLEQFSHEVPHGDVSPEMQEALHVSISPDSDYVSSQTSPGEGSASTGERIKILEHKLKTSETQIEKDWAIIEKQGEQIENMHAQFVQERDENHDRKEEIGKLLQTIHDLEQEKISLESKLRVAEEKIHEIEHAVTTVSSLNDSETESANEERFKLQQEVITLNSKVVVAAQELSEVLQVRSQLETELEAKDIIIQKQESTISELNAEISYLLDDITDLDCAVIGHRLQEKGMSKFKDKLREKVRTLSDAVASLRTALHQAQNDQKESLDISNLLISQFLKTFKSSIRNLSATDDVSETSAALSTMLKQVEIDREKISQLNKELERKLKVANQTVVQKDAVHKLEIDLLVKGIARRQHAEKQTKDVPETTSQDSQKTQNSKYTDIAGSTLTNVSSTSTAQAKNMSKSGKQDNLLSKVVSPADFMKMYLASRDGRTPNIKETSDTYKNDRQTNEATTIDSDEHYQRDNITVNYATPTNGKDDNMSTMQSDCNCTGRTNLTFTTQAATIPLCKAQHRPPLTGAKLEEQRLSTPTETKTTTHHRQHIVRTLTNEHATPEHDTQTLRTTTQERTISGEGIQSLSMTAQKHTVPEQETPASHVVTREMIITDQQQSQGTGVFDQESQGTGVTTNEVAEAELQALESGAQITTTERTDQIRRNDANDVKETNTGTQHTNTRTVNNELGIESRCSCKVCQSNRIQELNIEIAIAEAEVAVLRGRLHSVNMKRKQFW